MNNGDSAFDLNLKHFLPRWAGATLVKCIVIAILKCT
jgi:hypothetical protein